MSKDVHNPLILITRAQPEAGEFAAACEAAGYDTVVESVLTYEPIPFEAPDLKTFKAVVFTSARGVRAFAPHCNDMTKAVYCVGDNTAEAARDAGFKVVHSAQGGGEELAELLASQRIAPILYPRAEEVAFPLMTTLVAQNIQCVEVIVYKTVAGNKMRTECAALLQGRAIEAVTFFSKRTAEVFLNLASDNGLTDSLADIKALCIGPKVLDYVQTYSWQAAIAAKRPDREGMLALLKDTFSGEKIMSASNKKTAIDNASEIIERFGGIRPMAKKIDVAVTTIQGWKKRDTIPAARRDQVLEAAASYDVDLSDLVKGAPIANENSKSTKSAKDTSAVVENPSNFEVQKAEYSGSTGAHETVALTEEAPDEEPEAARVAPSSSVSPTAIRAEKLSEPLDQKIAEAEKKAITKSIWISVVLLLIGMAAIAALLWPQKKDSLQNDERLSALEQNLDNVQGDVDAVKQQQSFFGALIPDDLDEQLATLQEKAGAAQEQIGQVVERAKVVSDDVLGEDGGTFEERAAKLQTHMSEIAAEPEMAALLEKFNFMQQDPQGQSQIEQTMAELSAVIANARDQALNGGQEAIEGTMTKALEGARQQSSAVSQTFESVPTTDLKAAALLLGMTQFRSSLDRDNDAFEDDLTVLMGLVGEDNIELRGALERLAPHAQSGVLTPGGLGTEFKTLAGDAVVASLKGDDVSIAERTKARFNDVFQVEKNGELVTGTDTQATLQKADKMIEEGDLEGAIIQVQQLDGAAAAVMKPWVDEAQITLIAQKARLMLEQFANMKVLGGEGLPADAASGLGAASGAIGGSKLIHDEKTGINILKKNSVPNFGAQ